MPSPWSCDARASPGCTRLVRRLIVVASVAAVVPAAGDHAGLRRAADAEAGTRYVAHLMPWFDNSTRGTTQWCSNHSTPYYEPALGTYSSDDPVIVRKQLSLMRAAGLDGVWIDLQTASWLPTVWAIARVAAALELRVAVVLDNYFHANLANMLRDDLQELMAQPHYYRIDGRPILPIFEHTARWGATVLPTWADREGRRPFVIGSYMAHLREEQVPVGFDSLFFWHSPDVAWLEAYYKSPKFQVKVGSVFRGWRESYKRHMHSPPYLGFLNTTLQLARDHRPHFAQLVTWNDYGEGTMLEPSYLRKGATRCGDPAEGFWHSETRSCAELFGREAFTAQGRFPPCLATADPQRPCSGSGEAPCANVVDCAKPLGAALGPGPCGGQRSAFADLAAVARAVAGTTEAEATAAFRAILAGPRAVAPAPQAKAGALDLGNGAPRRPLPALALLAGLAALRL